MSGLPKRRRSPYTEAVVERRANQTQIEIKETIAAFKTILAHHSHNTNLLNSLVQAAQDDIRRPEAEKLKYTKRRLLFHFLRTSGYTANEIQSVAKLATNTILYHEKYLDDLLINNPAIEKHVTLFYRQINELLKLEKPL